MGGWPGSVFGRTHTTSTGTCDVALLALSILYGDQFQYFRHERCYKLLLVNTYNLYVCYYFQKIMSTHMANVRVKTPMTL